MDPIVACATAWGHGAVAMLRVSGATAKEIVEKACPGGPRWRARRASLRSALTADAQLIDQVLVTWMPGPRSYTGEDIVELSCHGNPVIVEMLLDRLVVLGARLARPGEFTRRAVENGRLDLIRAEAVGALIAARSVSGIRTARAGLSGEVSERLDPLRERLLDLTAELEARLDHPGDDLGYQEDRAVLTQMAAVASEADEIADSWRAGRVRVQGAQVALVGPVNAGKSSLFNHLVGQARALVSEAPGTTRDVVERSVVMDGLEVTFFDTAGQRSDGDALEQAGMAMGRALTRDVDLKLIVLPLHQAVDSSLVAHLTEGQSCPWMLVGTHLDQITSDLGKTLPNFSPTVSVSNPTGVGISDLKLEIRRRIGADLPSGARAVLFSQRQHDLFRSLAEHVRTAGEALAGWLGPAIAAEELTRALLRIGELRGDDVREDVLDRLFSRFCIGK